MKRTTLILEDGCMEGVRALARAEEKTMSQVVNDLLVEGLQRHRVPERPAFELPTFAMGKPRVPLGDRDALERLMEE